MNGFIKSAFIFVLGAGTGALGSAYFYMKKAEKACKEYEEQCRADYEELYALQRAKEEYSSSSLENSSGEKIKTNSEPVERSKERVDYRKYSKPDVDEVIRKAEEKLLKEEKPMEEDDPVSDLKGPRIIRKEEYGEDRSLDSEELYYYTDDDVLADEYNEIIDEDTQPYLIGDALDKFNFRNNSDRYRYVRNEKYGKDYRIEKIRGSFRPG